MIRQPTRQPNLDRLKGIRLGTFEEIRDAFQHVAKTAVALEGAIIEVIEP